MKSLIESIETNENLVKEYNSICGLSEFNKIKELRNKKLGHISEENVETSANENDLIVLYDRLENLYKRTRSQITRNPTQHSIEETIQSCKEFWVEIVNF